MEMEVTIWNRTMTLDRINCVLFQHEWNRIYIHTTVNDQLRTKSLKYLIISSRRYNSAQIGISHS